MVDPSEFFDFSGLLDPIPDLETLSLDDEELATIFEEPTQELALACGCGVGLEFAGEFHSWYCDVRKAADRLKACKP